MRLADYLFSRIENLGVKNVYGVTGRGSLYLSDAVARNGNLKWIAMHHEQAAGYAAIAEAQLKRNPAVVVVSSGCASTNLITPLLLAWQDFVPVIFISGQHFLKETQFFTGKKVRTYGQQEVNIIELVKGITKWSTMITDAQQIPQLINDGIEAMLGGRRGPIWLDVPLDLQSSRVNLCQGDSLKTQRCTSEIFPPRDEDSEYLKSKLKAAKRPLILIGSGVDSSQARDLVNQLSEKFYIPIIFAHTAVDTFSSVNENLIGSIGSMGCSQAAAIVLSRCDLLIVLGHRMDSYTTGPQPELFAQNAEVCIVDIDFTEVETFKPHVDRKIRSDIKTIISSLLDLDAEFAGSDWLLRCLELKRALEIKLESYSSNEPIDLYYLSGVLSKLLPRGTVVVTDSGYAEVIIPTNLVLHDNQRFLHPASQGSMGYALPASIGASINCNGLVCAIVGDGSIMMNLQELQTISDMKLGIVILVINNDAYGIIRKRQDELFRGRTIGTDSSNGISCPPFDQIAKAFGLDYELVNETGQLSITLNKIFKGKSFPVICEIKGLWDQKYSRVKPSSRRDLNLSPLEDQEHYINSSFEDYF